MTSMKKDSSSAAGVNRRDVELTPVDDGDLEGISGGVASSDPLASASGGGAASSSAPDSGGGADLTP